MFEVLYHHAKFGGARILPPPPPGQRKTLTFLFVSLSVTLLGDAQAHFEPYGHMKISNKRWQTAVRLVDLNRHISAMVETLSYWNKIWQDDANWVHSEPNRHMKINYEVFKI